MIKFVRKLWRLLGLVFPVLYFFLSKAWMIGILSFLVALFVIFEIYRYKKIEFNKKFFKKYKFILKLSEKNRMLSATWFMMASLIVVVFFERNIAILAIFFSNLGNIAAVFAGRLYGKFSFGHKNIEGSMAMLVVCVVIGLVAFFNGFIDLGVVLVGAFAATVAELFTNGPYDNLAVAVIAGLIMSLV
ncbi:MAG: hypothetical protein U9R08_04140 [Nanoarchaeota archaeon]|nr:hypothetical protein [Nanoarchaeota archaeon]